MNLGGLAYGRGCQDKIIQQQNPFIVIWEMTRTCELKCLHCQLKTQIERESDELTFEEGIHLIDEIAEMDNPLLVLTGGDVFVRPDFFDLAQYGIAQGLKVAIATNATNHVTKEIMKKVKDESALADGNLILMVMMSIHMMLFAGYLGPLS